MSGVVGAPSLLVRQIRLPFVIEGVIERDFAALEFLPGAVGVGLRDCPINVTLRDSVRFLVVKDGLER